MPSINKVAKFGTNSDKDIPDVFHRPNQSTSIPVLNEAKISYDFLQKDKKIPLLIFSHGMGTNRMMYSGICREWASHGMLVAIMDHHDGSCDHTVHGETGEVITFDGSHNPFDHACRKAQT